MNLTEDDGVTDKRLLPLMTRMVNPMKASMRKLFDEYEMNKKLMKYLHQHDKPQT